MTRATLAVHYATSPHPHVVGYATESDAEAASVHVRKVGAGVTSVIVKPVDDVHPGLTPINGSQACLTR